MRDRHLPPTDTKPPKKSVTPQRADIPLDPWQDWQPQWHDRDGKVTPHTIQERQAPTETVIIYHPGHAEEQRCQRRLLDARLWESLDPTLQAAATEIAYAYESLSKGLGFSTSNWERVPGARNPAAAANSHARINGAYFDWANACHGAEISHTMVIDVLCFGIACKALDRDRRVRTGNSRANLIGGLELYAHLQGWHARKAPRR